MGRYARALIVSKMAGNQSKPPLGQADEAADRSRPWSDPEFAAVITDRSLLRHTCYIELCPDHLRQRNCWNEGSLYYTETTFWLIAPALMRFADYNHYSFQSYGPDVFQAFTGAVRSLSENLACAERDMDLDPYWFSRDVNRAGDLFGEGFEPARTRLFRLTGATADTLENWIARSDTLHVLGL